MMPLIQINDIYHILNSWHSRADNEFTMEVSKPALNNLKFFFRRRFKNSLNYFEGFFVNLNKRDPYV